MPASSPRIAILGAGPSGLTLAALLSKSSIPYTIFDLRPAPTSSSSPYSTSVPSGSFDLHEDSGLLALRECGLYEEFQKLERAASEEMILTDKHGEVKFHDYGNPEEERPEIARNDLLALLHSAIPEDSIKWEHKIVSVSSSSSTSTTGHTLHFASGATFDADVIVGADGAWSKVRPLLTETKPHFSSVSCISLTIPEFKTRYPELMKVIGEGSYIASGEGKAIMAQRGGLGSTRIYLMLQNEEETYLQTSGLSSITASELETKLLTDSSLFSTWGKESKDLIAVGCKSEIQPTVYPLYMFPIDHTFTHTPGLTLIGDAAHLMTPFAGEGVNCAMHDALELARSLQQGTESVDAAIKTFENGMFERVHRLQEDTWNNLNTIFAENAPEPFVEFFKSHGPPDEDH